MDRRVRGSVPTARASPVPWAALLRDWDRQQEAYLPFRERRFELMFDVVEAAIGRRFRALDLGAGPGSLSTRLLRRFPAARAVAVDFDPVVLRLGRETAGTIGGRLAWVDARLGRPGWTDALPPGRFDVAISTTALHWLGRRPLGRLYRDLARRLRSGGLFLNGDRLPWPDDRPWLRELVGEVGRVRVPARRRSAARRGWDRWWAEARRVPSLRDAFEEQRRRGSEHPHDIDLSVADHERALRAAGFRDVATVWQFLDNRLLIARR